MSGNNKPENKTKSHKLAQVLRGALGVTSDDDKLRSIGSRMAGKAISEAFKAQYGKELADHLDRELSDAPDFSAVLEDVTEEIKIAKLVKSESESESESVQ